MSEKNSWDSFTDDIGSCLGSGCSGILGIIAVIVVMSFVPWSVVGFLSSVIFSWGFLALVVGILLAIWVSSHRG